MTNLRAEVARAAYIAHHKCGPTEGALDEPNMGRGGFKTEVVAWNAVADAVIPFVLEEAAKVTADQSPPHLGEGPGDSAYQAGFNAARKHIAQSIRNLGSI